MSAPNTIPCDKLSFEALVARVASTMDASGLSHPSYPMQPGRCRFCGHGLPSAFRSTQFVNGAFDQRDFAPGSEAAHRAELKLSGAGYTLVTARDEPITAMPTMVLASVGACDALTQDVFAEASRKVRAKAQAIAYAQRTKMRAREIVEKKDIARAAAALSKEPPAPAPDDGQF